MVHLQCSDNIYDLRLERHSVFVNHTKFESFSFVRGFCNRISLIYIYKMIKQSQKAKSCKLDVVLALERMYKEGMRERSKVSV